MQLLQSIEMTAVSFRNIPAAFRFSVRTLTADTADVCEGLDFSDLTGDRTRTTLIKSQVRYQFCYEIISGCLTCICQVLRFQGDRRESDPHFRGHGTASYLWTKATMCDADICIKKRRTYSFTSVLRLSIVIRV